MRNLLAILAGLALLAGCSSKPATPAEPPPVEVKINWARGNYSEISYGEGADRGTAKATEDNSFLAVNGDFKFNRCMDAPDPQLAKALEMSATEKVAVLDGKDVSLVFPDGKRYNPVGSGEHDKISCMSCDSSSSSRCVGGKPPSFQEIYVFAIPKTADYRKAKLEYRGTSVALADAPER